MLQIIQLMCPYIYNHLNISFNRIVHIVLNKLLKLMLTMHSILWSDYKLKFKSKFDRSEIDLSAKYILLI